MPLKIIAGTIVGIGSYLSSEKSDRRAKEAIAKNIEVLEARQDDLSTALFHSYLSADREEDIVTGQQKAVLTSLGVTGRSALSKGLINETRRYTTMRKGNAYREAFIQGKVIEAKIFQNRVKGESIDSVWHKFSNILNAVNTGVSIGTNLGKTIERFSTGDSFEDISVGEIPTKDFEFWDNIFEEDLVDPRRVPRIKADEVRLEVTPIGERDR